MILAGNRGDQAEELKDAAITASLIERFMSTRPVEFRDLYSMRYFYVNVAGTYIDGRDWMTQYDIASEHGHRGTRT